MEPDAEKFRLAKDKAHEIYTARREIWCPYLEQNVVLNSDGFHHLQFSARRERSKNEQLLKFRLLPLGLWLVKHSATLQEYRKILSPVGKASARDGMIPMKNIEYWGFFAIIGEDKKVKVRVVLRRIGRNRGRVTKTPPFGGIFDVPAFSLGNP